MFRFVRDAAIKAVSATVRNQEFRVSFSMNRHDRRRKIADISKTDAMWSAFPADMRAATELHRQGRLKEAADTYRKITKVYADHPDVRVAWSNLGATLQGLGKLDEAVPALKKARALKPDHPPPHHNLGMALAQQGKFEEALESLSRAVELDPTFTNAWVGLALVREQMGDLPLAVEAYRSAAAADPRAVDPRFNLGNLLFRLGQVEEARVAFTEVLTLRPPFPEAIFALGRTLEVLGDLEGAAERYLSSTTLAPQAQVAHVQFANLVLAIAEQDRATALTLVDRWKAAHPGHPLAPQLDERLVAPAAPVVEAASDGTAEG